MPLQLFHLICDPGSARVRRFVVEQDLTADVQFRNLTYDEPLADLKQLGGDGRAPALWDGERLFTGADVVIARLRAHLDIGREK